MLISIDCANRSPQKPTVNLSGQNPRLQKYAIMRRGILKEKHSILGYLNVEQSSDSNEI